MKDYRLRTDLQRATVDGFALPLGIAPAEGDDAAFRAPVQGYTVAYTPGEEDDPDTYAFHIVVSHERLKPILRAAFELLPEDVFAIIEIGSRDAYRSTDVYLGEEPIPLGRFIEVWNEYEPFLLEDSAIAAGANSEDPFVEVFLDQWKGLSIHVPLTLRGQVEDMLHGLELEEVPQTWTPVEDGGGMESAQVRPVLDIDDEFAPDVDELLLRLRHEWRLELNVDRETNVDEGGRRLGSTLWHAIVIVDEAVPDSQRGAYASIWATASSLQEMEELIEEALKPYEAEWTFSEVYTIDRVAFDERPDALADLPHQGRRSQVHLVSVEPWDGPPPALDTMGEQRE